jgi:hypothetical protein
MDNINIDNVGDDLAKAFDDGFEQGKKAAMMSLLVTPEGSNNMDYKQAIYLLHPNTTLAALAEVEYYGGFNGRKTMIEAINDASIVACNAMLKRIPKKVLKVERLKGAYYGEMIGRCPSCDKPLHSYNEDHKTNYCKRCGQALEW